jgi:hypothetical protein
VHIRAEIQIELRVVPQQSHRIAHRNGTRDRVHCCRWFEHSQAAIATELDDPTAVSGNQLAAQGVEAINNLRNRDDR